MHAKGPTFADLAAIYIKERRLAPYAEQCLPYRMGNFMPVFGHRQTLRILHQDLAAYVDKRRRDGVRDSTIRRKGNDIKALSQVMGSSPKTLVQHYQHVTDALAEKTVNLIPDDPPAAGRKSVSKAKKGQLLNLSAVRREMAKRG